MKKIIIILLVTLLAIFLIGCDNIIDSKHNSDISPEEQKMIEDWNNAIETDSNMTALKMFSQEYGEKENFEEFVIKSLDKLNEEKILDIVTVYSALDDKNFGTEKILDHVKSKIGFSEKDFQGKVEFLKDVSLGDITLKYINFSVTQEEIDMWINKNADKEEKIYFEKGQGFFANEVDYARRKIPAEANLTVRFEDVEYLGDFKCVREYGEKLDLQYQIHQYEYELLFFKDCKTALGWDHPYGNERWFGRYMIRQDDTMIYIYDREAETTASATISFPIE